jgi:hypothetical protein
MDLLLIGSADSIFFEHYIKNLKARRPEIKVDVFSVPPVNGKYDLSSCNKVGVNKWEETLLSKIKGIRSIIKPFYLWHAMYSFLRKSNKQYDIIHFKFLVPSVVLFPTLIMKHCKKSIATLWGAEIDVQKIFFSKILYIYFLKRFLHNVDHITFSSKEQLNQITQLGIESDKLSYAIYGSSIYDEIEKLVAIENKDKSKELLGIDKKKITISIGYSGKELHQHKIIINTLFRNSTFTANKEKFTLILPMTHGCSDSYTNDVVNLVKKHGATYKLLTKKMSDAEVARLRNATDIMLQLSSVDARSASVIESILAGSILISGKWLPYEELRQKQLYFYELENIDASLPNLILQLSENIDEEFNKCQNNKLKWDAETWGKVIDNWVAIYDKLSM